MVEGVHGVLAAEALLLGKGIPMLPDRRGSLGYRIEPGRECRLEHQLISILRSSRIAESLVQKTCSKETSSNGVVGSSGLPKQMLSRCLSVLHDAVLQAQYIRALRITGLAFQGPGFLRLGIHESIVPVTAAFFCQFVIGLRTFLILQNAGDLFHQDSFSVVESVPEQRKICLFRGQPVA